MKNNYFNTILSIIEINQSFFRMIQNVIDSLQIADINEMQYFMLFNIKKGVSLREFKNRQIFSRNLFYNFKKLEENGYIIQEKSPRRVMIEVTQKGLKLIQHLEGILEDQSQKVNINDLESINKLIYTLGNIWKEKSLEKNIQ